MPRHPDEPVPDALRRRVATVVSGVILAVRGRTVALEAGEDLFARGHLDSLGKVHLVLALQDEFGVVLDEHDVRHENLASVDAIAATIARKG